MKPSIGSFPDPTTPREAATQGLVAALESNIAKGDYLTARNTVQQDNVTVGDTLDMSTVLTSRGGLSLVANQVIGLKAGRTYWCTAQFRINTSGDAFDYRWYNLTAAAQQGSHAGSIATDGAWFLGVQPSAILVITPDVDTDIEVRVTTVSDTDVDVFSGHIAVVEIGATTVIGSDWIPLETKEIIGSAASELEFDYVIDGNRDEAYKIVYHIKHAESGTTRDWRVRVNNLISSTNVAAASQQTGGNHLTFTDWVLVRTLRDYFSGEMIINASEFPQGSAVAQPRFFRYEQTLGDDPASSSGTFDQGGGGIWTDTGNLTALKIASTVQSTDTPSTSFAIGSIATLYRKAKSPLDLLNAANLWTKAQTVEPTDLGTDSGTIVIDAEDSNTWDLVVDDATTIGVPTNLKNGQSIILKIRQDGTGSRDVDFNAVWDFGDEGAPDTTAAAANSLMTVMGVSDGTNIFVSAKQGFTNT